MSDLDVYKVQGFGNRSGFGDRPALLIVDFVNGFNDPALFGGGNIPAAITATERLLGAARRARLRSRSPAWSTRRTEATPACSA